MWQLDEQQSVYSLKVEDTVFSNKVLRMFGLKKVEAIVRLRELYSSHNVRLMGGACRTHRK